MILVSLVGEQPIPNILPLWQFPEFTRTQFAATRATLGHAEQMRQAIAADASLKHVEVLPPLTIEPYDLQKTRLVLSQAMSRHLEQGDTVCLNLTAGTKLMSLAALQAAYGTGITLLYVATETNQMIFLRSDGVEFKRQPIEVSISVEQYLRAYGFEVSQDRGFRPPREGDALEEEVERRLKESGFFDDVQRNVLIRRVKEHGEVKNELDVAATRNGHLAVCSCKAVNSLNRESLYELSSVVRREYAGIYCGKVLATTAEVTDGLRERARLWGIELVDAPQLWNIAYYMERATR
ncbi:MAG TPA: DUF1887 domain-containing protein [Anaerolinea thermolimosa]|uniref:DUF1887 domain-containing protein n=1 Tax=Anaerolinea thermolimosa TaxID=229919 RepID=A0A3D1JIC8_9CHLR|nr:DUF1887 family CARF protein [Anaerolinea thermolimosa]GAP05380.1 hypothetical protein ATHL_00211 [Anaerolinea thermolimosa]HCE18262.1 DUF1887 domain-containing protein [Anaerolinea thermolimosa]